MSANLAKKSELHTIRTYFLVFFAGPLYHLVLQQTTLGHLLVFRTRATIVGIRVDTDAATGCKQTDLLVASHIKPWRDCTLNSESSNKFNGLLLTQNLDALFDAGYISFKDDGTILISGRLSDSTIKIFGLSNDMKLRWIEDTHKGFLQYHRENIFRQ